MKPIFECSEDVRKLCGFLEKRSHATYSEMNRHVERDLNGSERHVLYSALRMLERDRGRVFVTERGVGVKLASNGQVARLSTDHALGKIRRAGRRAKKRQPIVNVQDLSTDERAAFYIGRAALQAVELAVGKRMRRQIEDAVNDRGGEPLDMSDTIALFKKRAH